MGLPLVFMIKGDTSMSVELSIYKCPRSLDTSLMPFKGMEQAVLLVSITNPIYADESLLHCSSEKAFGFYEIISFSEKSKRSLLLECDSELDRQVLSTYLSIMYTHDLCKLVWSLRDQI